MDQLSDPKTKEFYALFRSSGWHQSKVARKLHLSPATVSQYLSGKTILSETILEFFRMSIALHQSKSSMLDARSGEVVSEAEQRLIEIGRRLTPEEKTRFLALLAELLDLVAHRKPASRTIAADDASSSKEKDLAASHAPAAIRAAKRSLEMSKEATTETPNEDKQEPKHGAHRTIRLRRAPSTPDQE